MNSICEKRDIPETDYKVRETIPLVCNLASRSPVSAAPHDPTHAADGAPVPARHAPECPGYRPARRSWLACPSCSGPAHRQRTGRFCSKSSFICVGIPVKFGPCCFGFSSAFWITSCFTGYPPSGSGPHYTGFLSVSSSTKGRQMPPLCWWIRYLRCPGRTA